MIDIRLLLSNVEEEILFDETITFDKEQYQKIDILDLSEIHVKGFVSKLNTGEIQLIGSATGEMTLPCVVTLNPVKYPFCIEFDEIIDGKDENNLKKDENTLELKEYLWQNIVVEKPLRIVSDKAYNKEYKGNGWKLVTDEDNKKENTSLEVLKQLLDKE